MDEIVIQEKTLTLKLGEETVAELQCSPGLDRELAIGHFLSMGYLIDISRVQEVNTSIISIGGVTEKESHDRKKDEVFLLDSFLHETAAILRNSQEIHEKTGGAHGALVRKLDGTSHVICEDVGRQNAVDKVIGLSYEEMDISESLLLLSGRLTFEVVTKAVNSGYPILASFAVATAQGIELAKKHNLTLIGGLKEDRFWLYHEGRVKISGEEDPS